jgi:hypothetical protein
MARPEQRFMSFVADDSNQYRAGRLAYLKVLNTRADHKESTMYDLRRVVEGKQYRSTSGYKCTNAKAIVHDLEREPQGRDADD